MNLNELVGWYQHNISQYDRNKKDLSATTIGCGKYLRPTKQKTELIDVDLVRGSSFAKAKPMQTLFTVVRLALLRLLLLPIFSEWWVAQTSQKIYKFLLTLYVLQVCNVGIYLYVTSYCKENILVFRDLGVPSLLGLLLSVIHSQILATTGGNTGGRPQFRLKQKKRKHSQGKIAKEARRMSSQKLSNVASDLNVEQGNGFDIHRNSSTNCPDGLRNRNVKWNHIYSPYWLNKNRLESHVKANLEMKKECDEKIVGSSNIDGTGSPSLSTLATGQLQPETSDQHSNFDLNSLSTENANADVYNRNVAFLSPMCGQSNTVVTSPWLGVTSNSDCSYSSGSESDSMSDESRNKSFLLRNSLQHCSANDKISCTLWRNNKLTKVEMSVLDISSAIENKVETMTSSSDYIYIGLLLSAVLALVPVLCRICESVLRSTTNEFSVQDIPAILYEKVSRANIIEIGFGKTYSEIIFLSTGFVLRFCFTSMFFLMLAVAERTFKERLLYAKLFSHITSSRRAKKSEVPHFRLSKLRNIKTWLSVRSHLKRRGPQRSVDVIVSVTLMLSLVLVSFLCAESLNDSVQQHWQCDLEVFVWSCSLGCFILRFMTLGTAINAKYRSVSILITEQINLYLKMEQNPDKKQNLNAANSVLKLAADLLKEIELPFKISGFNINPYVSASIRVLIVSALTGICSDMLGFKIKLFKLKE